LFTFVLALSGLSLLFVKEDAVVVVGWEIMSPKSKMCRKSAGWGGEWDEERLANRTGC